MQTTNLISTPNIEGNIGSCTTQSTTTTIGNQVWRTEQKVILTNSCTGEIIQENTYFDYSGAIAGSILIPVIILFLVMMVFMIKDTNNW